MFKLALNIYWIKFTQFYWISVNFINLHRQSLYYSNYGNQKVGMEIQDIYLAIFDYDNLLSWATVYYSFLLKSK